ncbi:unnamed protein product [Victoria cruziana]
MEVDKGVAKILRRKESEVLHEVTARDFPPNFIFGVATSAYQVEGAANEGGRGDSIWDVFSHTKGKIIDGSNGDIAVDQYHRYQANGFGEVNPEGVAYYNKLIDSLLEKGIQPFVTLYHWDLPQKLHETTEGWLKKDIACYFASYAETCFSAFGDRVKYWITLNEPLQTSINGYSTGIFAPGRCSDRKWSSEGDSSTEPYLVAHNQLLAHAKAVDVYRKKFKGTQGGFIGISVDCEWAEPLTDDLSDKAAAQRRMDFQLGWYLDPIYFGRYPESMVKKLEDRLPKFTDDEVALLRNSFDFVGLNHYTTRYIISSPMSSEENGFYYDQEVDRIAEWKGVSIGDRAASEWLYVVPWGIGETLNYITKRYGKPPIYITENGMDQEDTGSSSLQELLNDSGRITYFKGYLASVARSIRNGSDIRGYFAWSLLDNFEWAHGYTKRFGIVYVDYKNGLSRHLKTSAHWFSDFLKDRRSAE